MQILKNCNKSKLISLYCHQKHSLRSIYNKYCFTHTKPFFKHAKMLTVYEINLFQNYFKNLFQTNLFSFRTGDALSISLKRTNFD